MSLHACIVGIDGSGKSSVSRGAPAFIAQQHGFVTAHAGDSFEIFESRPGGHVVERIDVLPASAAIAKSLRRAAKASVDLRFLYPPLKLAQMAFQDSAAHRMARGRLRPAWVVSDGNLLLNAAGRGGNYRRAASRRESPSRRQSTEREAPSPADIAALFRHLIDDAPLPRSSREKLPPLRSASLLLRCLRALGLRPAWLPDLVVFLDVAPEIVLERIKARGQKVDAHENLADLEQAREGYRRALAAFTLYRGADCVVTLDVGRLSLDEAVEAAAAAMMGWPLDGPSA